MAYVWRLMYNPQFGAVNSIFGFDVNWLYDSRFALPAVMVMTIWKDFGFAVILQLAGLYSLPAEVLDAAKVDGAGAWACLVLPMYYRSPQADEEYQVPNQYEFGTELVVAAITEPADRRTGLAKVKAWLPGAPGSTCSPTWSTTAAARCTCTVTSPPFPFSPPGAPSSRWTAAPSRAANSSTRPIWSCSSSSAPIDHEATRTSVTVEDIPATAALRIDIGGRPRLRPNDVADRAQIEYRQKTQVLERATSAHPLAVRLSGLQAMGLADEIFTAVGEILLAQADAPPRRRPAPASR